jgi:hypothetical protein
MNKLGKKTFAILSLMLAISYGISLASSGVSTPDCGCSP